MSSYSEALIMRTKDKKGYSRSNTDDFLLVNSVAKMKIVNNAMNRPPLGQVGY